MIGAKAHRSIDGVDRAYALVERVDRLVNHRQQNAVDDEGGEILRNRYRLAQLAAELARRLEGLVARGYAADQLDELHQRHGIHEVNADEALGIAGDRGEPR